MLTSEHIYTHSGWQRPVILQPGAARVRFVAEGADAVQVSYDRPDDIRRGRAEWLDQPDGASVDGISAIRMRVAGEAGTLKIQQDMGGTQHA